MRERKFRHSLDPFCNCSWHIEAIIHFFLHCSNYSNQNQICNIKSSLLDQNDWIIVGILLFRSNGLNDEENALITETTIEYAINHGKVHNSIFTNPYFSKSLFPLKSLIDSGSPYVMFFSCLVFQKFYIVFVFFYALLNVYHQT